LIVAGNDEENLTPALRERAAGRNVEFRGPVYDDAKWELLARASAFVLPSLSENFGNVVIEAMLMKTPVIVCPEVGVSDDVGAAAARLAARRRARRQPPRRPHGGDRPALPKCTRHPAHVRHTRRAMVVRDRTGVHGMGPDARCRSLRAGSIRRGARPARTAGG